MFLYVSYYICRARFWVGSVSRNARTRHNFFHRRILKLHDTLVNIDKTVCSAHEPSLWHKCQGHSGRFTLNS